MATHSLTGIHGLPGEAHYRTHGFTQAPLVVQWMATLRCPLGCPHCLAAPKPGASESEHSNLQTAGGRFGDMPLPAALDLVEQVAEMGVGELLITGGEPLVREDLGEVIAALGRTGQRWSLNTAVMPPAHLRNRIERHPPGFVAVSLDGPREVHDAFRGRAGSYDEATEAIAYFASLPGTRVAAGTTVTTRNVRALEQTRMLVAAGQADSWGIHLLVPEGRAAVRSDLELTRDQKRRLLADVIRWRKTMAVTLADEIGYAGPAEPLLRDGPFACGAGRTQCVVLPDGHVVPCNTLDVTTAAGNLNDRPLREIWRSGFAELRDCRPAGTCRRCPQRDRCGGGCWLHRRAGTHCSRDVWSWAPLVGKAAGVVLCLAGAAGAALGDRPGEKQPLDLARPVKATTAKAEPDTTAVEQYIMQVYTHRYVRWLQDTRRSRGRRPGRQVPEVPPERRDDPIWGFVHAWQSDTLPGTLAGRCDAVEAVCRADGSENLAVVGLALRSLADPIVGGAWPLAGRSQAEQARLLRLLGALQDKALRAHAAYVEQIATIYKAHKRLPMRPVSKAGPRPGELLQRRTVFQRLGKALYGKSEDRLAQLAKAKVDPDWVDRMGVRVELVGPGKLTRISGAALPVSAATVTVGPFCVLQTPPGQDDVPVRVNGSVSGGQGFALALPAGTKLTWADLLCRFGRAHGAQLHKQVAGGLPRGQLPKQNPLLLPVIRELPEALDAPAVSPRHIESVPRQGRAAVDLWLADFWML